jgi:ribulose-phosphate 3-epimerase
MSEIIPAILSANPEDFDKKLFQVEQFSKRAQIDIADGQFVPNRTVDPQHISKLETKLKFEMHLMVKDPQSYISAIEKMLPHPNENHSIIFHIEATTKPEFTLDKIQEIGLKKGIALNPETTIEKIEPYLDKIDIILFLSVNPGFQGSKFIPEVLDKIKLFKKKCPDKLIGIDGGINRRNIKEVAALGVDEINIGSSIWAAENPKEEYNKLTQLAAIAEV